MKKTGNNHKQTKTSHLSEHYLGMSMICAWLVELHQRREDRVGVSYWRRRHLYWLSSIDRIEK
jgi:hypothetical protein